MFLKQMESWNDNFHKSEAEEIRCEQPNIKILKNVIKSLK